MDVEQWLRGLGLERYASAFSDAEIAPANLADLTDADLKGLGLPLGPRKTVLRAAAALAAQPAAGVLSAAPSPAERRQLTVMFVDLVGSTALSARLDPEEMGAVLRGYQNAVAGEIARFEGHVAKFMGDGVFAYFGWPRAHEDEAERAVRAGLAVRDAVSLLTSDGVPLACRLGIATGLVVVGELIGEGTASEQTVVGDTPNLAARLQALAEPGQVVIGETTRRLVGGLFELTGLGAQVVKGIDRPVAAFTVTGERQVRSRFEARGDRFQPMVGRDQELALLLERWALAKAGESQGVLLVGEAGIGKSRIVRALLEGVASEPHVRVRYQCSPYHGDSAFWPLIQQLTRAAGFAAKETNEQKLDGLEALLAKAGSTAPAPLLSDLLGLDGSGRYVPLQLAPQVQRTQTLNALTDQLFGLSRQQPVLVVLEDAHWADPSTLELIEQALDRSAAASVLMLLTSRPEHRLALAGHQHMTLLILNRLSRADVEAIVEQFSAGAVLRAEVINGIVARSDGVPLFVEEMTKAIVETGNSSVPASLHDTLMARLDRNPNIRGIAQIAACIGRDFDYSMLADIADRPEGELAGALDELCATELVSPRGMPPAASYSFKHALVRDAAYESLLKATRRTLHSRIAHSLQCNPRKVERNPELLAFHLCKAGNPAEAVPHWLSAGKRALAALAVKEAQAHFASALDAASGLPPGRQRDLLELDARVASASAHFVARGWASDDVRGVLEPAIALCGRARNSKSAMIVEWYLCVHHFVRCQTEELLSLLESMVDDAERYGDPAFEVAAMCQASCAHAFAGNFADAESYSGALAKVYDFERDSKLALLLNHEPQSWSLTWMAFVYWATGQLGKARAAVREQLQLAERLALPWNTTWALSGGSDVLSFMGDAGCHLLQITKAREIARELDAAFVIDAVCPCHEGIARVQLKDFEAGYELLTRGARIWNASGGSAQNPLLNTHRGIALLGMRRIEEAVDILQAVTRFVDATGHKTWWPEPYRQLGRAYSEKGRYHFANAEREFLQAVQISKGMRAPMYELLASRDLARLWAERGERRISSRPSTALSPTASTRPTSSRRRRSWTNSERNPPWPWQLAASRLGVCARPR